MMVVALIAKQNQLTILDQNESQLQWVRYRLDGGGFNFVEMFQGGDGAAGAIPTLQIHAERRRGAHQRWKTLGRKKEWWVLQWEKEWWDRGVVREESGEKEK